MLSSQHACVLLQTLFGIILDALTLGILFSRISHPMQRSHSIFLSENAVILRRDGILKFCFRCADIKTTQVRALQNSRFAPHSKSRCTWSQLILSAAGPLIKADRESL